MVCKRRMERDGHRYDILYLPGRGEWQVWEYGAHNRLLGIANLPPKIAFRSAEPDYGLLDFRALRFTRGRAYLTAQTITRSKHGI
jgi:hypothetical protein